MSPLHAFALPFRGLPRIFARELRAFVLVPLLLNVLVFAVLAWVGSHYFEAFVTTWLPQDSWLSFLHWLLWPIFVLSYLLALFYGFTVIGNLLAAPFNSVLADRAEALLTGSRPHAGASNLLRSTGTAIRGELLKLGYLASRAVPLLLLNGLALILFPAILPVTALMWLLFGFWFLALEYVDFPMGNHDLGPAAQRRWLRQRRVQSLAFGAGITLLMLIPLIQLLAIPAAVVGATHFWVESPQGQAPAAR